MIFVFESLLENRKAKVDAWREQGQRWVKARNATSSYAHYSFEDYERRNPAPLSVKKVASFVLPGIAVGAVVAFAIWGIASVPPKKVDPNNPHDCSVVVKKDDKVAVTYGPFVGSEGTVINQEDGCGVNIKLTKSTNTREDCVKKGYQDCRSEKNIGDELNVDTSQNITKL